MDKRDVWKRFMLIYQEKDDAIDILFYDVVKHYENIIGTIVTSDANDYYIIKSVEEKGLMVQYVEDDEKTLKGDITFLPFSEMCLRDEEDVIESIAFRN